jgi:hypothetical protein
MTVLNLLAVLLLLVAAGPASGQTGMSGDVRTFGTSAEVAHTVAIGEFQLRSTDAGLEFFNATMLTRGCEAIAPVTPACRYFADLRLPAGAQLVRLELDGCDTSTTGEIQFTVLRKPGANALPVDLLGTAGTTGVTAQPGCAIFPATLSTPETIDNAGNAYFLDVNVVGVAPRFAAVRAVYRLQVSPPPATATFGDVPTSHPFFQFVEALVASGITAGCGGGDYCPDAPLTRGQMAVFLGKALGLQFAP